MPKILSCRSCNAKSFLKTLSLGSLYLSDFKNNKKKPRKYPLDLILCKKCSLLQLEFTTPPKYLYNNHYGYKSGVNKTMVDELKFIVNKSLKKINQKNPTVVDIGSNDGTLLKQYPKKYPRIGFEPVKKFTTEYEKDNIAVINDFFNYKSYKKKLGNKKADIITAISCFYDMPEPNKFLHDIINILAEDGILVIQQNYLVSMLALNAFDNIVHEHLEYYSLLSLENLLKRHNLEVFDVEFSEINGGSFRTFIDFKSKRKISANVFKMREKEKKLKLHTQQPYTTFAKRVSKNSKKLQKFIIQQHKKGKKIYIYGASTRGNTLLQYYKLDSKLITAAVERNPEKWGKYVSAVGIPIISEQQARKEKPDFMLVLPWFFKKEFLQREHKYLKEGGKFIFPLPEMKIASY